MSPDGTEVALVSIGDDGVVSDSFGPSHLHLFVVPAGGGDRRELPMSGFVTAPSWSPDGRWLAVERAPDGESPDPTEIWVVDAAGDEPGRQLVAPDGERFDRGPTWSPDGTRVAFVRADRGGDGGSELMVAEVGDRLAGGEAAVPEVLVASDGRLREPAWSVDGERVAVEVTTEQGGPSIQVLDAADGSVQATIADASSPTWTVDGRLLGYGRAVGISDGTGLWRVAEFVPDGEDGFAVGLPVPGIEPVYFLYWGFGVSSAPCAVGDGPLTAGVEPVPTIVVTVPSSGERASVLAREVVVASAEGVDRLQGARRAKLIEPDVLQGPVGEPAVPGEPPQQMPLLFDVDGPLVWVVCGEQTCRVIDPTTGQQLMGGDLLEQFDDLVDVAPP
ncbi:MAG: PD40 domain-containing protein [Acidimicrobiales bacterium]|nr:PD40 domain-containing protein [Acidimicrobiales bacterium]